MVTRTITVALAFGLASLASSCAAPSAARVGRAKSAVQKAERARNRGEPNRALHILESARAECGTEKVCLAGLFVALGEHAQATGDPRTALTQYEKALALWREVGDRRGEAKALNGIGKVHDALGQKQKALEYYEIALLIAHEVGNRRGEAETLSNIGSVYDDLGEKQKALEYYQRALPALHEMGDRRGEAETLIDIGSVYDDLGEKQKALEYYERALPALHEVGDRLQLQGPPGRAA